MPILSCYVIFLNVFFLYDAGQLRGFSRVTVKEKLTICEHKE